MALRNAFANLALDSSIAHKVLPNGDVVAPVSGYSGRFHEDFGGAALDPTKWDVITNTGGMTPVIAGSNLAINMGTNSGAVYFLLSKDTFTIPCDVIISHRMSQRIAGNEVEFGLLEVNSSGVPVDHPSVSGYWTNYINARLNGAVATAIQLAALSQSSTAENAVTTGTSFLNSTTSDVELQIECRDNESWLGAILADTASAKTSVAVRLSKQVPDVNKIYKAYIRLRNTAAPASATTVTIHSLKVLDIQEMPVEVTSGRGQSNPGQAIPVVPVGGLLASTAIIGSMFGVFNAAVDVTSAAITATTTTAAIVPLYPGGGSEFQINVTAVSGTAPTMDVGIEESDDSGTSWYRIYDFPRITAVGVYRTPILPTNGNRYRYVQTITGTTPSFTRVISRNQQPNNWPSRYRQFINRVLVPTTLNSVTTAYEAGNCDTVDAFIWTTTVGGTPAQYALQGSDDGINWFDMSTTVTATATGATRLTSRDTIFRFIRTIVKVAGVGTVVDYIIMKAWR